MTHNRLQFVSFECEWIMSPRNLISEARDVISGAAEEVFNKSP